MGVRGMSTFIKERHDRLLARHRLCNELVLVDGDNLMHHINNKNKGLNHSFGGDYHRYVGKADAFMQGFKRCGITPIILLDGGSDPSNRKLKTAFTRLADKLDKVRRLEPVTQHRLTCLPLLTKASLLEVLRRLRVPHAVCPFEADEPLAALARRLDCVVLSDDTDFCAFGVRCAPLRSLAAEPELGDDGQMFIDCMVFRHDRFMQEYGLRPALMPLLACLLGNDYVSPRSLEAFLRQLPRPYGERRGRPAARRIRGLLAWLRRHTEPEEALREVLGQVRREDRQTVSRLVRGSLANYSCGGCSELLAWLRLPEELLARAGSTAAQPVLPPIGQTGNQPPPSAADTEDFHSTPATNDRETERRMEALNVDCGGPDTGSNDGSDIGSDSESEGGSEVGSEVGSDVDSDVSDGGGPADACDAGSSLTSAAGRLLLDVAEPPAWLADALRRGLFTSDVINLISGQPLLQEPQVEDPRQPPACACVEPLLRWLCSCLHRHADRRVTLYRRADCGRSVTRRHLAPPASDAPRPPPLARVPQMGVGERQQAVLEALGWSGRGLSTSSGVLGDGMTETVPEVESESGLKMQSVSETVPQGISEAVPKGNGEPIPKPMPDAMLDTLPPHHHLLAASLRFWRLHTSTPVTSSHIGALLLPSRRSEPGISRLACPDPALLSGEVPFDRRLAHHLSQLQCVLAQAGNVNALMRSPFEPLSPAAVFAGPLVYNAVTQLRKFGFERAGEWMSGRSLEQWKQEVETMCCAVGVDPSWSSRRAIPASVRAKAAAHVSAGRKENGKPMLEVARKEGGRSKPKLKARPPPQLRGNKFAALVQGGDSDGDLSDDDVVV